ncbi:hypothetical protein GF356_07660 [candidate division GN15 bacterium]|nr:hypothetical protein [candidate division GN15 bacterium]
MKRHAVAVALALVMLCASGAAATDIMLDFVNGLNTSGSITPGRPVTFYLRLTNEYDFNATYLHNGFVLYSSDATWEIPTAQFHGGLDTLFTVRNYECLNCSGQNADTLRFETSSTFGPGLPPYFSRVGYAITTQFTDTDVGHQICLDSVFIPPTGQWLWSYTDGAMIPPGWDGPHCYTIDDPQASCSCPNVGNVDGQPGINVSDVTYLVGYLFGGGSPPTSDPTCPLPNNGDVNCDMSVNIGDLTYFVAYLFGSGPAPCDPCGDVIPANDTMDASYFAWLLDQFEMAILDTGSSFFDYVNNPGIIEFDSTWMLGDTTYEIYEWRHFNDTAYMVQATPLPPAAAGETDEAGMPVRGMASPEANSRHTAIVHLTQTLIDGEIEIHDPEDLVIDGNTVKFAGKEFEFDEPWALDPPVADQVLEVANNTPTISADRLAQLCQGREWTTADHIVSVTQRRIRSYLAGTLLIEHEESMSLTFNHHAIYSCPDGELLSHELIFRFQVSSKQCIPGHPPIIREYAAEMSYHF